MSESQALSPEAQVLRALENINIKDRVPMPQSVYVQIERCNSSISQADPSIFEANVRALLAMLPSFKKKEVLSRSNDYNVTYEDFEYESYCNIQVGKIDAPKLHDKNKPVKRLEDNSIDWSDLNIKSPRLVTKTETDYEKLYNVILDGLESANITWKIEHKTVERGKVIKTKVPQSVLKAIAQFVGDEIIKYREAPRLRELNYNMIVEALPFETPSTPLHDYEGDPWPEE